MQVYPNDDPDTAKKKVSEELKKEGWGSGSGDKNKGNSKSKSIVEEKKKPEVPTFKYSKLGTGDLYEFGIIMLNLCANCISRFDGVARYNDNNARNKSMIHESWKEQQVGTKGGSN